MKTINLSILSLSLAVPAIIQAQDKLPNVVLIYADDIGYGDLQCYGAKNVKTPNIDRLANNGIRFTNAHSVASVSTPSRYGILTGEYPWRREGTNVANGDAAMIIKPEQLTVADVFKEAGYATAAIGKWHLGLGDEAGKQDWNGKIQPNLSDIGFDYSYIMAATGDRVPCVFIENDAVANYDESAPIFVDYHQNFGGEPTGRDNPELLYNMKHSHGHDMSIVNGIGRIGYMKGGGKALWKDENIADSITTHAIEFIKDNKEKPFFLYFATNDVHVPRFPHERFRGLSGMGMRGDAIVQFDWCVGEIIKCLEDNDLLENTLIILSSDNGPVIDDGYEDMAEELLNGHDHTGALRGGKYSCYEAGTRVPFIVHYPSVIKNADVSDALVSQIDFLDVMANLIDISDKTDISTDGFSDELDTWLGKDKKGRPFVVEMAANRNLSIRIGKWKYITPCEGPEMVPWGPKIETGYSKEPQLFLLKDNNEQENLFDKRKRKAQKMKVILEAERTKLSANDGFSLLL